MMREGNALGAYSSVLQHHVWNIDPEEGLGLTDNSICTYTFMGNWRDIGTYIRMYMCSCAGSTYTVAWVAMLVGIFCG